MGLVTGTTLLLFVSEVSAYVGPGLGLGAIGVVLGILGSIVLAVFGLFWYPIKRIMASRKVRLENNTSDAKQGPDSTDTAAQADNAPRPGS